MFEEAIAPILDIRAGLKLSPLWWRLGIDQTVSRYRRTLLGPFWIASSTIATGLGLSVVFGSLFGGDWRANFPFILSGVLCFGLTSSLISDGAQTFNNASSMMQTRGFPLSFHTFLMCDKALINFAHQIVAFWFVTACFRLVSIPHWELIFTLPLVVATGFFLAFPLGMIATRFRDVNYFIGFALQSLFMMTPVFWRKSQIPVRLRWFADYNPLAHMVDVLREPLLGHPALHEDLLAVFLTLILGITLSFISLYLFRRRVVFWL